MLTDEKSCTLPSTEKGVRRVGMSLRVGIGSAAVPGGFRAGTLTDKVLMSSFTRQVDHSTFCYVDSIVYAALLSSEKLTQKTLRHNVTLISTCRSQDVMGLCAVEKHKVKQKEKKEGFL